jgi:hypothetical protein
LLWWKEIVAQLAGQSCIICNERIDGDFEAGFCATRGCPRHDACARESDLANDPSQELCPGCGATAKARNEFKGRRQKPIKIDMTRPCYCPICSAIHEPGTAQCDCGYSFRHEATEGRATVMDVASRNLMIGGLTLIGGLAVTVFSWVVSPHFGFYVLAYGAVLAGLALFGRGIMQFKRGLGMRNPDPE